MIVNAVVTNAHHRDVFFRCVCAAAIWNLGTLNWKEMVVFIFNLYETSA